MLRRMLFHAGVPTLALGVLLGLTSTCSAQIGFGRGIGFGIGFGRGGGFYPGGWGGYPMMGFGSGIGISRGMYGGPYYSGGYYAPAYGGYYNYAPNYSYYNAGYYDYAAQPRLTDSDVLLDVRVPANARVWVNGEATTQTGTERRYMTNDLTPGRTYTYAIKARWTEDGKPVEYERKVKVHGGEERVVNFNVPR